MHTAPETITKHAPGTVCIQIIVLEHIWLRALLKIHTLRVHYEHAAANLNSGFPKYAKVARVHYFWYNCTPNISRSADASVSVA